MLEQLTGFWQTASQMAGSTQPTCKWRSVFRFLKQNLHYDPTSSGYSTLLIIPGTTIKNIGRTLIQPVRMVAPWASARDLADNAFCTIICGNKTFSALFLGHYMIFTWSAHQYQMDAGVCPSRNPGHGMSDPSGALRICQES